MKRMWLIFYCIDERDGEWWPNKATAASQGRDNRRQFGWSYRGQIGREA